MTWLLATPFLIGLFVLIVILMAVTIETEKTRATNGLFSLAIALVIWHFRHDVWDWISTNPVNTALFTLAYIVGGLLWSIVKWKSYISRSARHFVFLKEEFAKKIGQIGSNWRTWISWLNKDRHMLNNAGFYEEDEPEDIIKKITISPADKKSVIVTWIAYWPMSFMATLLNDPVRRVATWVYGIVTGVYSKMSTHSVKNLGEGMNKYEKSDQKDTTPVT